MTPRLDDLIAQVESKHSDDLSRLSEAVLLGQHLEEVADHLIGHFVDRARRSGASWSDIGTSMGVTKQAAQKRFVPQQPESPETDLRIFERYTDGARAALVGAQDAARERGHETIEPAHIVLALLADPELAGRDDADELRAEAERALPEPGTERRTHIPFAPSAKKALELAHREALRRQDRDVTVEHLLVGATA
ncbi:Clp protease N-terminal domain-containing protein [Actinokineospora sp. UTMC 2448]|uniref:Clp protease N-terminal domain-containing protein n=1 Tax=Actinokineospora sp. UTMC 2448 TaxID=2268449 RepID=UPI0021646738|nr:Clp protease N-terminal domain-containing protein [Actinokineospora sp. UTMC 2448]UVS77061.1 putative ATP-dependent Clp protease ATP-binding subunit [Actinokineospora sp. UTMC 2448]